MRKIALILCILSFIACKQSNQDQTTITSSDTMDLNQSFDQIYNHYMEQFPERLAYLGIKKDTDKWDNLSKSYKKTTHLALKKEFDSLKQTLDLSKLNEEDLLNFKLFESSIDHKIEDEKWSNYSYPVNQMYGIHNKVPTLLMNNHPIDTQEDAENYIKRIQNIPNHFDQLITLLKENEAHGILPPKFVFDYVIQSCEKIIQGKPFQGVQDNPVYNDFKSKIEKLDISDNDKGFLKESCSKYLDQFYKPAYEKLIAFLKEQQKRATTDAGVWKFPQGDEFYKNRLKRITTTNLTPDQIHEIGLKEVARIHEEMKAIMNQVGFKGTLHEFFNFMRTDPQFYYPTTDEGRQAYIDQAKAYQKGMEDRLDEIFITKPKAALEVRRVEEFREQSAGTAFYNGPSLDGKRPGIFYANLYNMKNMPKYQLEPLVYHEAIPGHHMQISIAQELEHMPLFRKQEGVTAYIEGWGLYCELLPKEMGFYQDPYSDFGRLAMELWRACRLVVDTGIHSKKWTREQAIEYYKNNTPDSERDCVRMVERHIVLPGQATAYKIGMLKILELREKAKAALGSKFDIREFHDVILTNGAVPLDTLEGLIDSYIASKK